MSEGKGLSGLVAPLPGDAPAPSDNSEQHFTRVSASAKVVDVVRHSLHRAATALLTDHGHETHTVQFLKPKEIYDHIVEGGVAKAKLSVFRDFILSLLAGMYIGMGFSFCCLVADAIPPFKEEQHYNLLLGAFAFPLGLALVLIVGADLFTSDCAYMTDALLEGRVTTWDLVRNWLIAYFGNLGGALWWMIFAYWARVFVGRDTVVLALAHKKTSYSPDYFGVVLIKGIGCNWLVNLAVWQANAAEDITGKIVGMWLPIVAFIYFGFEHCVANMFLIPMSMMLGSGISVSTFIVHNLIPATIGNIIGGGFFVGIMYACSYGTVPNRAYDATLRLLHNPCWGSANFRKFGPKDDHGGHTTIHLGMGERSMAHLRPSTNGTKSSPLRGLGALVGTNGKLSSPPAVAVPDEFSSIMDGSPGPREVRMRLRNMGVDDLNRLARFLGVHSETLEREEVVVEVTEMLVGDTAQAHNKERSSVTFAK